MSTKVLINQDASHCVDAFHKLMNSFLSTFKIPIPLEEIFRCGLFVSDDTYATFEWEEKNYDFDIPSQLLDSSLTFDNKLLFVQQCKIDALEDKKPQWMIYVEENAKCDDFDVEPSTFLFIQPLKEEYKDLAEAILLFLASQDVTLYQV